MEPYPHQYSASARAEPGGARIAAAGLPAIETAPPPQFAGAGEQWSPELLLVAAVADCFVLTFGALAHAAHFTWQGLDCRVVGVLEAADRLARFTRFDIHAALSVTSATEVARACELLERTERSCVVGNSLRAERSLKMQVEVVQPPAALRDA